MDSNHLGISPVPEDQRVRLSQFLKLESIPRTGVLVKSTGLEPATHRFQVDCSTTELTFKWVNDAGVEPTASHNGCSPAELIVLENQLRF
jgi:hypothetical protein